MLLEEVALGLVPRRPAVPSVSLMRNRESCACCLLLSQLKLLALLHRTFMSRVLNGAAPFELAFPWFLLKAYRSERLLSESPVTEFGGLRSLVSFVIERHHFCFTLWAMNLQTTLLIIITQRCCLRAPCFPIFNLHFPLFESLSQSRCRRCCQK